MKNNTLRTSFGVLVLTLGVGVCACGPVDETSQSVANQERSTADDPQPQPMPRFVAVYSEDFYNAALAEDGTVWTWGANEYGRIGNGTDSRDNVAPTRVEGISDVAALALGSSHVTALKKDGTVFTWGRYTRVDFNQVTDKAYHLAPVQIEPLTGVVAIASGIWNTVALQSDGTVWVWGKQYQQYLPIKVKGLPAVKAIVAHYDFVVCLAADGTVWAFGQNDQGQLATGTRGYVPLSVARQAKGLTQITALFKGHGNTFALKEDGTVWAWGRNLFGELGVGTRTYQAVPTRVNWLADVKAIVGSEYYFTLALTHDGAVWAWGRGYRSSPQRLLNVSGVEAIATGGRHSLALTREGTVWAWGENDFGQLGDGTAQDSVQPQQVPGLEGVAAIASGSVHNIALKSDGTLWAWGRNYDGDLGLGYKSKSVGLPSAL